MALGSSASQSTFVDGRGDHEEKPSEEEDDDADAHQSPIQIGLLHKGFYTVALRDCGFSEATLM
jgi:hypothetical protein